LLADFRQAGLQLIESVIERLNLSRELVHVRATVGLLFLQCALKIGHRRGDFVHAVSALLDQVFHDPHALVEGLLHVRHLVLKSLYLSLQLDDLPANAPCGRRRQPQR